MTKTYFKYSKCYFWGGGAAFSCKLACTQQSDYHNTENGKPSHYLIMKIGKMNGYVLNLLEF